MNHLLNAYKQELRVLLVMFQKAEEAHDFVLASKLEERVIKALALIHEQLIREED